MKIDIISGFLGAGKTTLIKKLIAEAYAGEKIMLIENEFGEIGIDGGFLQDAGINITEMNSGCICCSLVGDFGKALAEVITTYHPDRIVIEPSGVGKLSDVVRAASGVLSDDVVLNCRTTVADVNKCKMYMKNFGEFFNNQIEEATCIVLSHTGKADDEKIAACVALLREHNTEAVIVTTDWEKLTGAQLLEAMEQVPTLAKDLAELEEEHHHHHHDDDDDDECECHEHHHHHDDDDDECECHGHHHHDDDDDEDECECHDHEHHHHHHHHADEVFDSFGVETTRKFTEEEIRAFLNDLGAGDTYGTILRAKGIVESTDGTWIHFDYVPGEPDIRHGSAGVTGRICVIGASLDKDGIRRRIGV